ncbi:ArdC family protein [Sandaracinobacteroides hominis]|uniref:ArdC family protein n=1 Tax=Sandaracinobacteroides hominis TaxID=2780086 RepID=UPI0018F7A19E|nr:zincin-like metallopeptidase domain-containing protein [Sandaracinobacteroides hominis]
MSRTFDRKPDIYTRVTAQIIALLEAGTRPWIQPWQTTHAAGPVSRPLRFNLEPYFGINILTLWGSAMSQGFAAPVWMTFRQALELGGHVRKGETGSPVVYANSCIRTETDPETGESDEHSIPFLKAYTVFNVEQIEGLPDRFLAPVRPAANPDTRIGTADAFFAATGADIRHCGSSACYIPALDRIHMPQFTDFRDAEGYYATLAHEMTHWTGHSARLERSFGRERFGDAGYAMEELVAELGAAFLCADLELTLTVRDDHASYIASWLKVLKGDTNAVFTAAAQAQRAADWLHRLQPG